MNENHIYDMIVIGGGPGGYTAALYAARAGLDVLVVEKLSAGGQIALTERVDNYPGFEDGIDGFTLGEKMQTQAERFGAKTAYAEITEIDLQADPKRLSDGRKTWLGKTVVIATGAVARPLGLPEEAALVGRGVAYCAACDGMMFRGKNVVVIGGGNSAAADALLLSRIAKSVTVIHRRDALRATKIYHQPLMQAENVRFCWNSAVTQILHENKVTGVKLKNVHTGEESTLACDGVFVSIGRQPATAFLGDQVQTDDGGYIIADETTKTSVAGVFAVGDVRTKQVRQVVTAVSDGAVAAHAAEAYLTENG